MDSISGMQIRKGIKDFDLGGLGTRLYFAVWSTSEVNQIFSGVEGKRMTHLKKETNNHYYLEMEIFCRWISLSL